MKFDQSIMNHSITIQIEQLETNQKLARRKPTNFYEGKQTKQKDQNPLTPGRARPGGEGIELACVIIVI